MMKSLAVIPVADVVSRAELIKMEQSRDEKFCAFAARVQGVAEVCRYQVTCGCGATATYTDQMVVDVITEKRATVRSRSSSTDADKLLLLNQSDAAHGGSQFEFLAVCF